VECTPPQHPSPITRPAATCLDALQHETSPFPFHVMTSTHMSSHASHEGLGMVSLYMVMGEREVQYPLSLTLIGHALA
jgi:hypothetical protein